jgi:sugar phosphate isomerase/epimerase
MKLAAQMYTLREFTQTPEALDEALGKVAEIGYPAVQLSAIGALDQGLIDAAGIRALLDKYGLRCCATHRPLKRLLGATDEEIAFHKALGCDYVAVGSTAGDYGMEPSSYRRFLEDARPVIAAFSAAGIRFGFHNHALEFRQRGRDHYDLLLEEPSLQLEIDVYWVAVAGLDPAALLRRAAGRIAAVHLKDLEVFGWEAPTYAPVGEGNLDWDAILTACREGGTEWGIVEQDTCRRDPFDCLASSYRFLSGRV